MNTGFQKTLPSVMIVDDTKFSRELLRAIVEKGGYAVAAEAADGDEAVGKYWEVQPKVTIMDIIMPKKNGIEATREILAFDKNARVIICSAAGHEGLIKSALEAGAVDYCHKPLVPEMVLAALQRATTG